MILRDYQQSAVDATVPALREGRRVVLVAPTGSGKTVIGAAIAAQFPRVLWAVHRRELVQQAADRLTADGLDVGLVIAGETPRAAPVQVASIQTLANRESPPADLVVYDEAHHVRADTYGAVLAGYDGVPVLGLTATPFRLDGKGLGSVFSAIIVAARVSHLCADGTLLAPKIYSHPVVPDLSRVKVERGDYQIGVLGEVMNDPQLIGDIITHWRTRAGNGRTVVFAVDIAHSLAIKDRFVADGIPAEHIDASTPKDERSAVLTRLRDGTTKVLCNCMILTEGWDLPALEVCIMARPTASLCLYLQMIGRIMRCTDGKAGAILLDHAGNRLKHGDPLQDLTYSLDDVVKQASDEPPSKRCPQCYLWVPASVKVCPSCGYEFVVEDEDDDEPVEAEGELVEIVSFVERAAYWDMLQTRRAKYGYKEGWVYFQYKERYADEPIVGTNGRLIDTTAGPSMAEKRSAYDRWLKIAERRGYKRGWAAWSYRKAFGVWPRFPGVRS